MMRATKSLVATLTLLLASSIFSAPMSIANSKFDMSVPASYGLGPCNSATEMECIESVEIRSGNSSFVKGRAIRVPSGKVERVDDQGNVIYERTSDWQTSEGLITVTAHIDSMEVQPFGASLRLRLDMNSSPGFVEKTFRVVVRESLLRPMNVQLLAVRANAQVETYQNGRRWILEGRPRVISSYDSSRFVAQEVTLPDGRKIISSDINWSTKADFESQEWNFYIHHADKREGRGYFADPLSCADSGFSITSFNAPAAGDPFWDKSNNSLNFAIAAPAYKVDGTRNEGFFYFSTTHQYLDCKYKDNTFGSGTQLVLEIVSEDGSVKTATTSITNTKSKLEFFAAGFTYSSPKVVLREAKATEAPTQDSSSEVEVVSPEVSQTSEPTPTVVESSEKPTVITSVEKKITCLKGKSKKILPPGKTKCPRGWKKKK